MPSLEPCLPVASPGRQRPHTCVLCFAGPLTELVAALASSVITTSYTLNLERQTRAGAAGLVMNDGTSSSPSSSSSSSIISNIGSSGDNQLLADLVYNPPPSLMLAACLVLGCSVSSFVYRQQGRDPFQLIVFLTFVAWAAVLGCFGLGASVNLVLLGYMPWALCAAMPVSAIVHQIDVYLGMRRTRHAAEVAAMGAWDEKSTLTAMA